MDVLGVAPVPHPSVPDLDLRLAAASFLLSLRLPRRRLLPFSACSGGAASFLSGTLTPPPPGRLLPPLLHCSGDAAGRIAGTRRRRPRTALTPAQTAASPAGPHWRRLRYRYVPSRPSLMCPAREILILLLCAVQMASSGDVGRANASAESSHRWEIE